MKTYKEILKNIEAMDWNERVKVQVALAVYCAADGDDYSEDEFCGLCKITKTVLDDMDNPNLQLIADAVCDAYFNKGYGYAESIGEIYVNDFEYLTSEKEEAIIDAVWNRIIG